MFTPAAVPPRLTTGTAMPPAPSLVTPSRGGGREPGRAVYTEPMLVRNLSELRAAGMHEAASQAIAFLTAAGVEKVWLHLDADCLDDDELMPAVDWRMAGGLSVTGAVSMARPLVRRG